MGSRIGFTGPGSLEGRPVADVVVVHRLLSLFGQSLCER